MTIRLPEDLLPAQGKRKNRGKGPSRLRSLGRAVLDALLPPKCAGCGAFYAAPAGAPEPPTPETAPPRAFSQAMAPYFCPACRDDFAVIGRPVCTQCGQAFTPDPDGGQMLVCPACRDRPMHFRTARAFGIYDGGLKTALHLLKYRSRTHLARPLGTLLFSAFQRFWTEENGIDCIVPVPLHPGKLRRRGFNQAHLLVRRWPDLARAAGMAFPKEMIQRSALRRIRATETQVGMRRSTRRRNIRHAFAPGRAEVVGRRILLVDDVYTTGATADECARTLKRSGAESVDVLTLAQTVRNL